MSIEDAKKIRKQLTREEKNTIHWLFHSDSMWINPDRLDTYHICNLGLVAAENISKSIIPSLIEKGLIQPLRVSVKECKMQIALGTDINIGFTITQLGIDVECLDHNTTYDERLKKLRELKKLKETGRLIK